MKELIESLEAVQTINQDLYEKSDGCQYLYVELQCDGDCIIIKFLDQIIWNSDDDLRIFYEEGNEYEPIENYLRREINELLESIRKIEL